MRQKTPIYQVWISTDCTNNARKKHQLHKLSLWKVALSSSRYQCITSHQLHCIAAPLLWHFVWRDVQQMCCSGEPSTFISADGTYLLVDSYLNWLARYKFMFIWSHFKPTGKKTLSTEYPPPLQRFISF